MQFYCDECKEKFFEGQSVIKFGENIYCESCFDDLTINTEYESDDGSDEYYDDTKEREYKFSLKT